VTAQFLAVVALLVALPAIGNMVRSAVELLARLIAGGIALWVLLVLAYALFSHGWTA
jgi:hypothetical protein